MRFLMLIALAPWLLCSGDGLSQEKSKPNSALKLVEAPAWLKNHKFSRKEFTFVRLKYTSRINRGGKRGAWQTDYPEADQTLSALIEHLTPLDTSHKVLDINADDLAEYPLIYLVEPGLMRLTNAEVEHLRDYCKSGGMLVLDDSWGEEEFQNVQTELKRVFPDQNLEELPLSHELFKCVFQFKNKPQVPSVNVFLNAGLGKLNIEAAEYKAITDEKGRIMVLCCHNTDLGDGWGGLNGANEAYAQQMSAKLACPMGVNIVYYSLTR